MNKEELEKLKEVKFQELRFPSYREAMDFIQSKDCLVIDGVIQSIFFYYKNHKIVVSVTYA